MRFVDDRNNIESRASDATEEVAAAPNRDTTGAPTITGMPQVGQTLTASTSGIADQDGLTNATFEYQWIAGGSDIGGATGSTYTLTASEQGQTIQVRVTFTDDRDNEETLTSAATVAVTAAANREATGQPTISGTPQVGETLTADTANIVDQDGLTGVSYTYQWIAGGTDIDGATGSSYELTSSEQGQTIQVRVTFTDDADNEETLTSEATVAVAAAANREATGQPTISGTPQVGRDADGGYGKHRRPRRANRRLLHLPVDRRRVGHRRGQRLQLHPDCQRAGADHQGEGVLHRRRRPRGDPDQRGDGGGCSQAQLSGHGNAHH